MFFYFRLLWPIFIALFPQVSRAIALLFLGSLFFSLFGNGWAGETGLTGAGEVAEVIRVEWGTNDGWRGDRVCGGGEDALSGKRHLRLMRSPSPRESLDRANKESATPSSPPDHVNPKLGCVIPRVESSGG